MDAGSYTKDIADTVSKNCDFFYIRADKSESMTEQISRISEWEKVEINYKTYEAASIPFKQFSSLDFFLTELSFLGFNKPIRKFRSIIGQNTGDFEREKFQTPIHKIFCIFTIFIFTRFPIFLLTDGSGENMKELG